MRATEVKRCKECRGEIPADAKRCMHCGVLNSGTTPTRVLVIIVLALVISAVLLSVGFK